MHGSDARKDIVLEEEQVIFISWFLTSMTLES
jgi:hypothetical protein